MPTTQLRPQHVTGRRYGSFAGRAVGVRTIDTITQLRPQHATGRRYGSFAGRSEAIVEPAVILYGGDDAPRQRKRRKEQPREDFFKEIEHTIHRLIHPETEPDTREADVRPHEASEELERQYQALVGLAQESHESLQALGHIRREIDAYIAKRKEEDDEEDLLMLL